MDEPTNDLDAETLELLEDRLMEYPGTLIVVSHDRAFLNNVVTSTLAFEGQGAVREYVGGYDDWLRQRPRPDAGPDQGRAQGKPGLVRPPGAPAKLRKLGFKEQREAENLRAELAALPARIEALEKDLEAANGRLADPALYKQPAEAIARAKGAPAALEADLAEAFARWERSEARLADLDAAD